MMSPIKQWWSSCTAVDAAHSQDSRLPRSWFLYWSLKKANGTSAQSEILPYTGIPKLACYFIYTHMLITLEIKQLGSITYYCEY